MYEYQYFERPGITWDILAELEPELDFLLGGATIIGEMYRGKHNWVHGWCKFKDPIARLVGLFCGSEEPLLRTVRAYDIVYRRLHGAFHGEESGAPWEEEDDEEREDEYEDEYEYDYDYEYDYHYEDDDDKEGDDEHAEMYAELYKAFRVLFLKPGRSGWNTLY